MWLIPSADVVKVVARATVLIPSDQVIRIHRNKLYLWPVVPDRVEESHEAALYNPWPHDAHETRFVIRRNCA